MRGTIIFHAAAALLVAGATAGPVQAQPQRALALLLEEARRDIEAPGIAAAVWRDGRIVEAAAGERALGTGMPVLPGDAFHVGSITKPFAAMLAARLAERGILSWSDTVEGRLGPLFAIAPAYRRVTLADLLAHRGGLQASAPAGEDARLGATGVAAAQRLAAAELVLNAAPAAAPRERVLYSNYSYVVAAAVIEQAAGRAFEDLLRDEVLTPLGLAGAGFGAPGRGGGAVDAPWGHWRPERGASAAIPPDARHADNAPFLRPAGGLHMPMRALALFGADQLQGGLLRPETYRLLQRPVAPGRTIGWALGPGGELFHDGTNLRWFALVRILPAERLVIAIAANSAGDVEATRRGFWALSERLRRELR
jgi:D-alanyl-D-alanine carboxypeptidase